MKFKYFILPLLALFLFPMTLSAIQYELMRVAKIDVTAENLSEGTQFNANAVKARMRTRIGNLFSQNDFDCDLKMLAEEYSRIEPLIEVINDEIYISLELWLKPTIHDIYFCGNEHFSQKKLFKELGLQCGTPFERDEFICAFNELKLLYVKKGYFEAEFNYEIIPVDGGNAIDIRIDIDEGRAGKIKSIDFCGLSRSEENELLEMMVTKKYQLFLSWLNGSGCYHPDMIEHDRLQITNFLQNHGYADAIVDIYIEEANCNNRINLIIDVDRGPCYYIGDITFSGNTLYCDEDICAQFKVYRGAVYSPECIRATIQALTNFYGTWGYIDTSVDVQLALRDGCPVYDIDISIEEGKQYNVGLIKVFGNRCTQTRVILHESLLCPGEIFDIRRVQGTEIRLYNTGLFSCVNVYAVRSQVEDPNSDCLYRDIYIEVEEANTGNVGVFFGFSSLDRLFGGVELTERNFNLLGATRLFQKGPGALRGGGEFFNAKINIGDRQTNYHLQWTKPYFLDTPWILGVDLEKTDNRALSRGYEIKTYGGSVHATYILNNFLKYDFYYRARHTKNTIVDSDNQQLEKEGMQSGLISALGNALIYNSTDHPRRPTRGLRSRLIYELAGIGGNYDFMKFCYFNSYYYPICKRGVFKARADLQFIYTYGTTTPTKLPLSERFFLGGETTVRGYRPYIIGPKFAANSPRGGVSSLLLSEEYQHTLIKNPCIDAFVFMDAGYVSLSEFTIGQYAASVGFGVRMEVMRNMPMTFGLGWPIHPSEKYEGKAINNAKRFFFSAGGNF